MAEEHDAESTNILSSAYYQPQIVQAYLDSTLKDASFPKAAIQALQTLATKTDSNDLNLIPTVHAAFEQIHTTVSLEQSKALKEAIKAMSLSSIQQQQQNDGFNINVEQRISLGYCKILDRKWIEAIVGLDAVREHLYHKMKRDTNPKDASKTAYISALNGLMLASALLGKQNDVGKYGRWIKKEQESSKPLR